MSEPLEGLSLEQCVQLVDIHRTLGNHDVVAAVGRHIAATFTPPTITGEIDMTLAPAEFL